MKAFKDKAGRRDSTFRFISIIIGIFVNVILSYISYRTGLPLYLDTIGTIGVAAVGGLLPGIITAVLTNTFCMFYNGSTIYFCVVNAIIAIWTAWFSREKSFNKIKDALIFVLGAGAISGLLSAVIQWGLLGGPQNETINTLISSVGGENDVKTIFTFIIINICFNIFDKGISFGITLMLLRFIPEKILNIIKKGGWRQKPLSSSEMKDLNILGKESRFSLQKRMMFMLLVISLTLVIITGLVSVRLYFNNAIEEKKENAQHAAEFAAKVVDPEKIESFINLGEEAPGYKETKDLLYEIRKASPGVRYLYLLRIERDKCTFIMDLEEKPEYADKNPVEPYSPGDVTEVEDAFIDYMDEIERGETLPVIESEANWGWVATAYYPVKDAYGRCVCYAGADVSIDYIASYMEDFFFRVLVIMAGFFILIFAYGLYTTGTFLTYPVSSIAVALKDFMEAGTDQNALDESVRKLRKLDVHTDDELEKLYNAICDMAANQSEQMRGLRRFSENTVKMQDGLIITMADLVENRDSDTGAHVQKTAAYVKIIVEGLKKKGYYAGKITPKFMSDVVRSAPLHDVGKINVPDAVLNKPGKLTDEEYEIIKTHTTAGKKIMEAAINTVGGENYLKEARNMAAYHHERWDGKGYPEGLHGEVIPLSARIMAVADVFDALASPRVYKPAFPLEKALQIIQEGSGTQFDPKCVEVFMDALPEVKVVLKKYHGAEKTEGKEDGGK